MFEFLIDNINQLYQVIIQPFEDNIKREKIVDFKKQFNISDTVGEYYHNLTGKNKQKGIVYTPNDIVQFMIKNTVSEEEFISNPFMKIFDPSCGVGNFIIPIYKYLKNIIIKNYEVMKKEINYLDIDKHIVENNIFGTDIDEIAIKILKIDLYCITGHVPKNIFVQDYLFFKNEIKYDVVIGNPPYIGHKTMDKKYSKVLKEKYFDVFNDKADISYCFFSKTLNCINEAGKISFLVSRYFMESPSGSGLRNLLSNKNVNMIVDFYGLRPFKNIGIDPVIIFINMKCKETKCNVIKPDKTIDYVGFIDGIANQDKTVVKDFCIDKNNFLNETWMLIPDEERIIINKIEKKSKYKLNEICDSYQGIITGCDKAFIINDKETVNEIEKELIKKWIKNSNIKKGYIEKSDKYIIYSDKIKDESIYPNAISHINEYKEKLMERRECKKGIRKWYELQWGRDYNIFENGKIVFPYKASENKFTYDKGSYFSADIYCLVLKNNMFSLNYNYKMILDILNSKLYEFYFQSYGKKLGRNMYEYYPNTVCKLKIPIIINNNITDEVLYDFFNLTEAEIKIIASRFFTIPK